MRIFLAGATGAIGRRLLPLLVRAGHEVTGTTRSAQRRDSLRAAGATPVVVNVYDADALLEEVLRAEPEIVIHQLTDLPQVKDPAAMAAKRPDNTRLRIEGTRNLMAAATAAGTRRVIAQSIAFVYPPGHEPHVETEALPTEPDGSPAPSVRGAASLEEQVLGGTGIEGIVLRYGRLYGPGTWEKDRPAGTGYLHVDAAAGAALLAVTRGAPGIYNIAEDDGEFAIDKARRELGFDPKFRL
jgi:nucleoside-diphosphate-sugar epimerase